MTTWKNILTSPPTLYKTGFGLWSDTVLATNGTDVFIGNVAKEAGGLFFTGRSADCYECEERRTAEYDLTGWQWMPTAAPEREKTADEMFRGLGYHLCFGTNGITSYVNSDGLVEIYIREGMVAKETCFGDPIDSTEDEILACAKWIEERRANDVQ